MKFHSGEPEGGDVRKLLVVALLVLACNGEDNAVDNNATAPPSPAPELAATAVPVQMVFEGLIAFEQVDKNAPEKGMYALMVDATGANPAAGRPPCAIEPAGNYPDHATAIYVEGAELSLTVGGVTTNPGKLVLIEDEDITFEVDPPTPYVTTPASLAKLVDSYELYWASQSENNGKIVVDRDAYLAPDDLAPKRLANLAGRIFINSGVAAARANVCAKSPPQQFFFGFQEVGSPDCESQVRLPVELGEDVLVTLPAAKTITLKMVTDPGTGRRERKLVIEPDDTSKMIRINFRNVMKNFVGVSEADLCDIHGHLDSYQWLYNLTKQPTVGCKWVPCVYPNTGTVGGGKCPSPGPGG
jgi:hypothetical protein